MGSSGSRARVSSKWITASNWSDARARKYRELAPLSHPTALGYLHSNSREQLPFLDEVLSRVAGLGIPVEGWHDEAAPGRSEHDEWIIVRNNDVIRIDRHDFNIWSGMDGDLRIRAALLKQLEDGTLLNIGKLQILNRTFEHAERLAALYGGTARSIEDLEESMVDADVVEGAQIERLLDKLFAHDSTDYVHVHYAKRGCYAARVERA